MWTFLKYVRDISTIWKHQRIPGLLRAFMSHELKIFCQYICYICMNAGLFENTYRVIDPVTVIFSVAPIEFVPSCQLLATVNIFVA